MGNWNSSGDHEAEASPPQRLVVYQQQQQPRARPAPTAWPQPPAQSLNRADVLTNAAVIERHGLQITRKTESELEVEFRLQTFTRVIVTAFPQAVENPAVLSLDSRFKTDVPGFPQKTEFPEGTHTWRICLPRTHASPAPLVILARPVEDFRDGKKYASRIVYCNLTREGEIFLTKQKAEHKGKYFELNEIFGIKSTDESRECVVCLSEPRTTALLPCRHLCLCWECATAIQLKNQRKCPICRSDVSDMVLLNIS